MLRKASFSPSFSLRKVTPRRPPTNPDKSHRPGLCEVYGSDCLPNEKLGPGFGRARVSAATKKTPRLDCHPCAAFRYMTVFNANISIHR
jgi:hypothetical protein